MINLSLHCSPGFGGLDHFEVWTVGSAHPHITLYFKDNQGAINIFMIEDQMIELMKVLQDHFMERAGFQVPGTVGNTIRYHGDGDPIDELTPGEIIIVEEENNAIND